MPIQLTSSNDPRHQGSGKPVWLATLHQISLLGELSISYMTSLGEDNWKLVTCFLLDSSVCTFSFTGINLYPFTVKKKKTITMSITAF